MPLLPCVCSLGLIDPIRLRCEIRPRCNILGSTAARSALRGARGPLINAIRTRALHANPVSSRFRTALIGTGSAARGGYRMIS
jgi:hypothetical protein